MMNHPVKKGSGRPPKVAAQRAPRAERRKTMLDQFKNINVDRMDIDELVNLASFGRQFRQEFESLGAPVPEYVDDNLRTLRGELNARLADRRAARAREIRSQLDSLKSREEKRTQLEQELAALGG